MSEVKKLTRSLLLFFLSTKDVRVYTWMGNSYIINIVGTHRIMIMTTVKEKLKVPT